MDHKKIDYLESILLKEKNHCLNQISRWEEKVENIDRELKMLSDWMKYINEKKEK